MTCPQNSQQLQKYRNQSLTSKGQKLQLQYHNCWWLGTRNALLLLLPTGECISLTASCELETPLVHHIASPNTEAMSSWPSTRQRSLSQSTKLNPWWNGFVCCHILCMAERNKIIPLLTRMAENYVSCPCIAHHKLHLQSPSRVWSTAQTSAGGLARHVSSLKRVHAPHSTSEIPHGSEYSSTEALCDSSWSRQDLADTPHNCGLLVSRFCNIPSLSR